VAHGLDIVAVGIEYEGAAVIRMVERTRARRTVVGAAGGDRRLVEIVDDLAAGDAERDVDRGTVGGAGRQPEIRPAGLAESGPVRIFEDQRVADRRERPGLEFPALVEIADAHAGVVDHVVVSPAALPRASCAGRAPGSRPRFRGLAIVTCRRTWRGAAGSGNMGVPVKPRGSIPACPSASNR
jgi:hypothetical protein